ncbi:sulfatase-like hydrolase/transferase [Tichowtungia aerotolerans]|uniref:Sulfatase-like hydrolase/transferase n=1 Tax=Tichowtungia aerotolerans TaxID=2697043 RepID=A0A6P1M2R6_9BACT|nr:sulfatase-like hydrolase/transferase [Tichowtungia aerotolerans]QHI69129.1 sulfatase-like hydrolase/transferase [Tichowtungia aerotolerans]
MDAQPNILFIMTDQQQAETLSCLNHSLVNTPNLDRIAARGVNFTKAYCPSPVCGPSRTSIFCGEYPAKTGTVKNYIPYNSGLQVLPEALRSAGYETALAGKLHLAPIEDAHGFEEKHLHDAGYDIYRDDEPANSEYVQWLADKRGCGVDEIVDQFNEDEACLKTDTFRFIMGSNWRTEEEHSNTWVTECTLDFLRKEHDRPFFMFTSYFGPHQPMMPPEPWASMVSPDDIELPPEFMTSTDDKPLAAEKQTSSPILKNGLTEQQYREALAAYYGQIMMIDHGVGRILDELDAQGLADNTIIVFTADHGDHAGQFGLFFKSTMYENAVRVPLLVSDPSRTTGVCGKLVNNLDLYATLLECAGVDAPPTASRSLVPLLDNPASSEWENVTYSELYPWTMVAKDDWKLIRFRNEDGTQVHELYRLDTDVADSSNVWNQPETAAVQNELVALLDRCEEKAKGK